jgi:hypothetical protein
MLLHSGENIRHETQTKEAEIYAPEPRGIRESLSGGAEMISEAARAATYNIIRNHPAESSLNKAGVE